MKSMYFEVADIVKASKQFKEKKKNRNPKSLIEYLTAKWQAL